MFISITLLFLPFCYGQSLRGLAEDQHRFKNEYLEAFADSDRISTAHLLMRHDFELSQLAPSLPFSLVMETCVFSDGNGDYFSALSSAGAIRESFTPEELDLNVIYVREDDRELPNVDLEEYGLQKDHVFDLYAFDLPPFLKADAVLSTPVKIPDLPTHPVSMFVTQYGGLSTFVSSNGRPSMDLNELGIDPTWATRGIHVLDPEKIPSDASDFDREELSQVWKMLDCDAALTKVYFGYKAGQTYYELVTFLSQADERIVIFSTTIPENLNRLAAQFKTIKIYSMTRLMETRAGTGEGELILVRLETVSHSDFLRLMKRSEPFVACTGDLSLSEAISLDKLPFYSVPFHNRTFWAKFRKMMQFYLPNRNHPLNFYLALLGKNAGTFRTASAVEYEHLMNPAMMKQIVSAWTMITKVIRQDFNSKTHLKVVVKELAARAKYGNELIEFQENLAQAFADDKTMQRSTVKMRLEQFLTPEQFFWDFCSWVETISLCK